MMGHREKMISGDEYDAFTRWKKVIKTFDKPGIAAKTKKRFNRRVRKLARIEAWRTIGE